MNRDNSHTNTENSLKGLINSSYNELLCSISSQDPWNSEQHKTLITLVDNYISARVEYYDEYLLEGNARIAEDIIRRKENLNKLSVKINDTRNNLKKYAEPENIENSLSKIDDMIHQYLANTSPCRDTGFIR